MDAASKISHGVNTLIFTMFTLRAEHSRVDSLQTGDGEIGTFAAR